MRYESNRCPPNDELQHFGIFGMKWGVRRFQNPDGTLTEEGKKRYGGDGDGDKKGDGEKKEDRSSWDKDDPSKLSDEELNRRNSRLQREQQYKQLTKKPESEFGKFVKSTFMKIFVGTAVGVAAASVTKHYKKAAENLMSKSKGLSLENIEDFLDKQAAKKAAKASAKNLRNKYL